MSKMQKIWWVFIFLTICEADFIADPYIENYRRSIHGLRKWNYEYIVIEEDELIKVSTYDETFCAEKHTFSCTYVWPYVKYASYFQGLYLRNSWIPILKKDLFSLSPDLTYLHLTKIEIGNIEEDAFSNLKNLRVLNIENCMLVYLPQNVFADLRLLKNLFLSKNHLNILPAKLFDNNVKLTTLHLHDNMLGILPKNLFLNNKNLEEVDFHKNYFEAVPADMLNGLEKLKHLDLGNNLLKDLPNNLFDSCVSLATLCLGNNRMKKINCSIFSGLDSLKELDLSESQITNITVNPQMILKSVEKINLSRNQISDSNSTHLFFQNLFNIFPKLNSLNVLSNRLNSPQNLIDVFINHLRHMEDLNNSAIYLPTRNPLDEIKHFFLDLSQNYVKEIDLHDYKESNHYIWDLNLERNVLKCNCNLYDVLRYSNNKVNTSLRISTGFSYCKSIKEHKNIALKKINYQQYECRALIKEFDEEPKCPSKCSLRKRLWDKMIIFDCSNQNYYTAPETLCSFKSQGYMIELDLTRNQIRDFPNFQQTGYNKVVNLILSYNNISTIPRDVLLNHGLKVLRLDNNQLTTLSADTIKEISFFVESIELGNNPWKCDCDVLDFHEFLLTKNVIKDADKIICESSKTLLRNVIFREICSNYNFYYVSAAFMLSIFLTISFLHHFKKDIKIWLYARNLCLWIVTEEELDKDKLYDAFVSYSHKDEEFVVDQLVANLEEGPKSFKLCLHFRDWTAGLWIPTQIENSIKNSKRTIIVLSRNFIESDWGKLEFKTAHKEALDEGRVRLIIILFGDVGPIDDLDPDLKSYLKMNTFVKWGDPWFWDKLQYALPHKLNSEISEYGDLGRAHPVAQLHFNKNDVAEYSDGVVSLMNANN